MDVDERAFVGVYNSAFKSGYMIAPALAMVLLHFTGFDGNLVQQTQQTQELMKLFMVLGIFFTFFAAIVCSYFIKLSRADIDDVRKRLDARVMV